jgi:hypothetical protein
MEMVVRMTYKSKYLAGKMIGKKYPSLFRKEYL